MNFSSLFRRTGARLLDLLVPRVCPACDLSLMTNDGPLCGECGMDLAAQVAPTYCHACGHEHHAHLLVDGRCFDCREGRSPNRFSDFVRVGRYDGVLQRLILRFKRDRVLDEALGRFLADAILGRMDPATIDLWVPVPSHWTRRLARGFHPARLLAERTARVWRGRVANALAMTRPVPVFHHGMTPSRRAEAIRGAFRVPKPHRVAGRHVCLIDDVSTTGVTLAEARRTLKAAGAAGVSAAVLAKTLRGETPLVLVETSESATWAAS